MRQYKFFFRPSIFKLCPSEVLLAVLVRLDIFTGCEIVGVTISDLDKEEDIDTELAIEESTDRGNDGVAEDT